MFSTFYKNKLIIFLIVTGILSGVFFIPVIFLLSDKLSKTSRIDANVLIVEGWLPHYAIELAYDDFKNNNYDLVITTGIKMSGYYMVYTRGYLIFYTADRFDETNMTGNHTIEIDAYSELEGENSAHFNVFVNDSIVADFYADRKMRKYAVTWNGNLAQIDSVMVQFDNDKVDKAGDRNLYVKEVIIDRRIHISYQNYSEYDIGDLDRKDRFKNNFGSYAEFARNELLLMGLDSSLVLSVPGNRVRINRTLSSALAFREWLNSAGIKVNGINIVTLGTHAKRSWLTYNKILDKKYNIGIISLPDYKTRSSRKNTVLKTLREILGIAYYWIILLPY